MAADKAMDCSFYTDCLEAAVHCGPDGYALGYGGKYCQRFSDNINYFSQDGQKWITGTLTCLKNNLVKPASHQGPNDCNAVMNMAFDSHVPCYVNHGFCKLAFHWSSPSEEFHFLRALMRVYDVKDFASLMAIKQIAGVVK